MDRYFVTVLRIGMLVVVAGIVGGGSDGSSPATSQGLPAAKPEEVGLDPTLLSGIDQAVGRALHEGALPGCVILILRQGKVVYHKAFGYRQVLPEKMPMELDTVFDLASLTKPVATASSIMLLVEQGRLRLAEPVYHYLPEFKPHKEAITIRHVLLHVSGLVADNPLADYHQGPQEAWRRICHLEPLAPPGARFIYSDVGYIVLGRLVEQVSGQRLDEFFRKQVADPMGMKWTGFVPPASWREKIAPTEYLGRELLHGTVHDPRARALGGIAGHAGLFSTAGDLARFASMVLNDGLFDGRRILSVGAVRLMTHPHRVPGGLRGLGWDVDTRFSHNRGELFGPDTGFGHTGFTGTSMWIDRPSQMAVIFLSNRVHPHGKGQVNALRHQVATLAARSIAQAPLPEPGYRRRPLAPTPVLCGIDVLKRDSFRPLQGKKVGLVTNHTGRDSQGQSTIDLLHQAPGVKLQALFAPEHGLRGLQDRPVADGRDERTGLPVYSLYGKRRRPTEEQVRGLDALVYDIQDVGCRFYTYITTLGYILETAARYRLKVYVLDRPNPIGGLGVEGPILDKDRESFTGYHPLPVRHGMTVGELALLFNRERGIGADLEVIRMDNWYRDQFFDETGLEWVAPSPNMRTLTTALVYPGVGLLETTNISVGRGTDRPFEVLGAPWVNGASLARTLQDKSLPGVRFVPIRFTPTSSVFAGQTCHGIQIIVDDWNRFEPVRTGLAIACCLKKLHPNDWQSQKFSILLANHRAWQSLESGADEQQILAQTRSEMEEFLRIRAKYLLYPARRRRHLPAAMGGAQ